MKKLLVLLLAALLAFACFGCVDVDEQDSGSGGGEQPPVEVVYGLPVAETGHYIKDADVLQDGNTRYLLYTTNEESGEEDNVIAVRIGEYNEEKGDWLYGEENIVLRGQEGAWDEYIGSAAFVKGNFTLEGQQYNWLMAYCATNQTGNTQNQIGLAVAQSPDGEWVKASTVPFVEFDPAVYGESSVGCYAPALINMNGESVIRIIYTYADAYGHFARFVDVNAANIGAIYSEEAKTDVTLVSGSVQMPNNGEIEGGDAEAMFPNADFAFDAANKKFYAVKDYSPSAGTVPAYAEKIQLLYIAEEELYNAENMTGWVSVKLWDMFETPDGAYERLYSATIVTGVYGEVLEGDMEIVYNVCEIAMENDYWMFTQNLLSFTVTAE